MRSIIYYNLKERKYSYTHKDITFYFSSLFYLNKFKKELDSYLDLYKNKLEVKYDTLINCEYVLTIQLYKVIEKRGFRVDYKGENLRQYHIDMVIVKDGIV